MKETPKSIMDWSESVFGPTEAVDIATRMTSEVLELIEALKKGDTENAKEECADVAIMFTQITHKLSLDLGAKIDEKMAVNRNRRWIKDTEGKFQRAKPFGICVSQLWVCTTDNLHEVLFSTEDMSMAIAYFRGRKINYTIPFLEKFPEGDLLIGKSKFNIIKGTDWYDYTNR